MHSSPDQRAHIAAFDVPSFRHDIPSRLDSLADKERSALLSGLSRRVHGIFASTKNSQPVPWRTRDEEDAMFLLEVDPGVLSYEAVPERISFTLDGKPGQRIPSFRIQTRRGAAVIDIFPATGASSEHRHALISTLTEIYADRGTPYRALTGHDIRLQPRFGNAQWIVDRGAHQGGERDELLVVGALSVDNRRTVAELASDLLGVEHVDACVCAMTVRRLLRMDLSASDPREMSVSLHTGGLR